MAGGDIDPTQPPAAPVVPKPQFAPPVAPEAAQLQAPPGPPPDAPPPAPPTELAVAAPDAQKKQGYFCLEANHPGQSTPRADHFDMSRMFYSNEGGAPTCPLCRKHVSALAVEDTSKLPPSLQATADRLAVAERQR
jgi:hypothetical protein